MIYAPSAHLYTAHYAALLDAWGRGYAALMTFKSRQRLAGRIQELAAKYHLAALSLAAMAEEDLRMRQLVERARAAFRNTKLPASLRTDDPIDQLCREAVDLLLIRDQTLSDLRAVFAAAGYTGNLADSAKVALATLAEYKQRAQAPTAQSVPAPVQAGEERQSGLAESERAWQQPARKTTGGASGSGP